MIQELTYMRCDGCYIPNIRPHDENIPIRELKANDKIYQVLGKVILQFNG